MRVLMLSSRIPYPLTAGFRIRIYNEARYFKKHGDTVDLLFLGTQNDYDQYKDNLLEAFDNVYFVPFSKVKGLVRVCLSVFSKMPFQVALYNNAKFLKKLLEIENQYDLVIGNHIRTSEYLKKIDVKKTILDLHDAISYNYSNIIRIEKGIKRIIYKIEYKRVLRYEKEIVSVIPKNVIVSENDREWLNKNGADVSNVSVIPVAVRDDICNVKTEYEKDENAICFLGKMSYQPNNDAVIWFSKEVMPRLVDKYPDIVFYVLGIEPSEEVLALGEKSKNIKVTGYLDNPFEIMAQVKATVVPIRNGAGVQNKVLESMIVGTPVVASSIAANGIGAINDEQIIIANDPDEYIDSLSVILNDVNERERLGQAGKKYIEENYTWASIWDKWEALIKEEGEK